MDRSYLAQIFSQNEITGPPLTAIILDCAGNVLHCLGHDQVLVFTDIILDRAGNVLHCLGRDQVLVFTDIILDLSLIHI